MSTFAEAIAERCAEIVGTGTWWSEFSPAPDPGTGVPFIQYWFDLTRDRITHVTVKGQTYGWGQDWPGNESGDGFWYAPATVDGQAQTFMPYPLCVEIDGVPTLVRDDTDLLVAYDRINGVLPAQVVNNTGAVSVCFDPAIVPPGSQPTIDLGQVCTVGTEEIHHYATSGPLIDSWKKFCPPPAPYGSGGLGGGQTNYFLSTGLGYAYQYGPNYSSGGVSWFGPITVECGQPILEITIDYTNSSLNDDFGIAGFALMDPSGAIEPTQGTTATTTSGDCTGGWSNGGGGPQQPRPMIPAGVGANTVTFQTLNPQTAGAEFWLHAIHVDQVNSITVSCLNP